MGADSHFCCCLPLRLGVFLISLFQFLFCLAAAGVFWAAIVIVEKNEDYHMTTRTKIITIGYAAVQTIIALMTLLGFLGTIRRKQSWINIYATALAWALGFNIGIAVVNLVSFFKDLDDNDNLCTTLPGDQLPNNVAEDSFLCENTTTTKVLVVVFAVIPILLNAYALFIVNSYVKKLQREKTKERGFTLDTRQYSQVATKDMEGQYPYSDPAHSYGQTR